MMRVRDAVVQISIAKSFYFAHLVVAGSHIKGEKGPLPTSALFQKVDDDWRGFNAGERRRWLRSALHTVSRQWDRSAAQPCYKRSRRHRFTSARRKHGGGTSGPQNTCTLIKQCQCKYEGLRVSCMPRSTEKGSPRTLSSGTALPSPITPYSAFLDDQQETFIAEPYDSCMLRMTWRAHDVAQKRQKAIWREQVRSIFGRLGAQRFTSLKANEGITAAPTLLSRENTAVTHSLKKPSDPSLVRLCQWANLASPRSLFLLKNLPVSDLEEGLNMDAIRKRSRELCKEYDARRLKYMHSCKRINHPDAGNSHGVCSFERRLVDEALTRLQARLSAFETRMVEWRSNSRGL